MLLQRQPAFFYNSAFWEIFSKIMPESWGCRLYMGVYATLKIISAVPDVDLLANDT